MLEPLVDIGTLKYGSSGIILIAASSSTGMLPFVVTVRNAVDLSTTSVSLADGWNNKLISHPGVFLSGS